MGSTSSNTRNRRLAAYVWGLALVALVASGGVGMLYSQLVSDVSRDREKAAAQFTASKEALARVQAELARARAEIESVLTDEGALAVDPAQDVEGGLERCRSVLEAAGLLSRPLEAQLNFFRDIRERAYDWRTASTNRARELDEVGTLVRMRFDELHGQVEQIAGRRRLEEVSLSVSQGSEPSPGRRVAPTDLSILRAEVSDLAGLALRLSLERKIDNLVSLKDNQIAQSLQRLRRGLAPLIKDQSAPDAPSPATVDDLETLLFGAGGLRESGRDRPVDRQAGLYVLRRSALLLEQEQKQLVRNNLSVSRAFNDEIREMLGAAHEGLEIVTERAETAVEAAHRKMQILGAGVVVLFLGVCSYISRAIQRQVRELETTMDALARVKMDALARVNRAHEDALQHVSLLSSAMRAAANAIVITDRAGTITWVNPAFTALTGYAESEALGSSYGILDEAHHSNDVLQTLVAGGVWQGEVTSKRKDGTTFIEHETVTPVMDASGEVSHVIGIKRDITLEKRSEEALRQAHAELELVLRSVSAILIGFTRAGRITAWNEHADASLGRPKQEAVGATLEELGLRWNLASIQNGIARCVEEGTEVRLDDIVLERSQGDSRVLGLVASPMRDASGTVCGCVLLGRDITEHRSLEVQLSSAQKLESIGRLAAGIAHEINTPTQYVGDNIRFLEEHVQVVFGLCRQFGEVLAEASHGALAPTRVEDIQTQIAAADLDFLNEEIPSAIRQSLEGIGHIATIVRAMKEFSHPGAQDKSFADLNHALESTITVGRNEWKYVSEIETDFDPALPQVRCMPGELNQVFLNIIVNAAHAIGDVVGDGAKGKGKIRIATKSLGEEVEIRISDTGGGIPQANLAKIFEPFFTTKGVGKGTGQGLAIAHAVITKKHGGSIEVESEVGRGTTFIIRLPVELKDAAVEVASQEAVA